MIRTAAQLTAALDERPFPDADPEALHIAFLREAPAAAKAKALVAPDGPDEVAVIGREVHLHYPDGMGRSKLSGASIEKRLGVPATARRRSVVEDPGPAGGLSQACIQAAFKDTQHVTQESAGWRSRGPQPSCSKGSFRWRALSTSTKNATVVRLAHGERRPDVLLREPVHGGEGGLAVQALHHPPADVGLAVGVVAVHDRQRHPGVAADVPGLAAVDWVKKNSRSPSTSIQIGTEVGPFGPIVARWA